MAFLKRAWQEIKSGENIDLYLTVVFAAGIAILNLLEVAPQSVLGPITLAILALLALTALGNRHRVEDLPNKFVHFKNDLFVEEFPTEINSWIESASELWLIGASLSRTIKTNYSVLERKLQKGHMLRVLVIHPEGPGLKIASERSYLRRSAEKEGNDIIVTLEYLCDLKEISPDNIQVRTIRYPLHYGAFAIEPSSVEGRICIENYPYRISGESLPKFVLTPQNGKWYRQFKQELEHLWANSEEWNCRTE